MSKFLDKIEFARENGEFVAVAGVDELVLNASHNNSVFQKDFKYEGEPVVFSDGTKGSQPGDVIPGSEATGSNSVALGGLRYDYYTSPETHAFNLTIDPESTENWGRTPTSAEGNQSFAAGGSCHAYGDWSVALGRDSKAYQHLTFACGGAVKAGMSEEEWEVFPNKQADFFRTEYKDAQSFAAAFGESSYAKSRSGFAACMANKVEPVAKASAAFGELNQVWGQKCLVAGTSNKARESASSTIINGYNNDVNSKYSAIFGNNNMISSNGEIITVCGLNNTIGSGSHIDVKGRNNDVSNSLSYIYGDDNVIKYGTNLYIFGSNNEPAQGSGSYFSLFGANNKGVFGDYTHTEGYGHTRNSGSRGHVEGTSNSAYGNYSHVEGGFNYNYSGSDYSHTGGAGCHMYAKQGFVHGYSSKAFAEGECSTTFGFSNENRGKYSLLAGSKSKTYGDNSVALGEGLIANAGQFVVGKYNEANNDSMFVVGGGDTSAKRNLFDLKNDGSLCIKFPYDIYVGDIRINMPAPFGQDSQFWTGFNTEPYGEMEEIEDAAGGLIGTKIRLKITEGYLKINSGLGYKQMADIFGKEKITKIMCKIKGTHAIMYNDNHNYVYIEPEFYFELDIPELLGACVQPTEANGWRGTNENLISLGELNIISEDFVIMGLTKDFLSSCGQLDCLIASDTDIILNPDQNKTMYVDRDQGEYANFDAMETNVFEIKSPLHGDNAGVYVFGKKIEI